MNIMNIMIEKDVIKEVVGALRPLTGHKEIQILNNFLIIANEDCSIEIMANNLFMGGRAIVQGIVTEAGKICVPSDIFLETLAKIPGDGYISIIKDDNEINISCGNASLSVATGGDPEQFPMVQEISTEKTFSIPNFKSLIAKVLFSVSLDDTRPVFTGVNFKIANKVLNIVSVDGYRVSKVTTPIDTDEDENFTVPGKVLSSALKFLGDNFKIGKTDNSIVFKDDTYTITASLLAGEYLDYESAINQVDDSIQLKVNRKLLLSSIEFSSIASKDKKSPVGLMLGDEFVIKATNTTAKATQKIENFEYNGDEVSIYFNPLYLLEALKVIDDTDVTLLVAGQLVPVIIKGESYTYLILPIRYQG